MHAQDLCAWVVNPVPVIMRELKGSNVRRANQLLGRAGQPLRHAESCDHWVRNRKC